MIEDSETGERTGPVPDGIMVENPPLPVYATR